MSKNRIPRGIFRRSAEFVAVKRIKLTAKSFVEIGETIDRSIVKTHQLQNMYNLRRIGELNSPWANNMIENSGIAHYHPEVSAVVLEPVLPKGWSESYVVNGKTLVTKDMINSVLSNNRITIKVWNGMSSEAQTPLIREVYDAIAAIKPTPVVTTFSDTAKLSSATAESAVTQASSNPTVKEQPTPVKIGANKWAIEGVAEVFATKTLANEYLAIL